MTETLWYVYLLECGDGSFYCGIAKDVARRLAEHESGNGARYTRGRGPLKIVWQSGQSLTHSDALKLEIQIKAMTREQKRTLITFPAR
jgi:predicted GIY-YIG superfamily endonuclease